MELSVVARNRLGQEVIASIGDFADLKDDQLYQEINNTRTSIPSVAAVLGALVIVVVPGVAPIPPCIVSEKCALFLKVTSTDFHYYHAIGRNRIPAIMNYTKILRTVYIEW